MPSSGISTPPEHRVTIEDWRELAACRDTASSVFFIPDSERGLARAAREARAQRICQRCLVLAPCRDHVLAAEEPTESGAG